MISGSPFRWTEPSTWPWIVYVWLALILVGWLRPVWRWIKRQRASSWPTVSGQIEYASVSEAQSSFFTSRGGNSPSHVGELGYSYFVAGNTYSGRYKREFWSEEEALEFQHQRFFTKELESVWPSRHRSSWSSLSGLSTDLLSSITLAFPVRQWDIETLDRI